MNRIFGAQVRNRNNYKLHVGDDEVNRLSAKGKGKEWWRPLAHNALTEKGKKSWHEHYKALSDRNVFEVKQNDEGMMQVEFHSENLSRWERVKHKAANVGKAFLLNKLPVSSIDEMLATGLVDLFYHTNVAAEGKRHSFENLKGKLDWSALVKGNIRGAGKNASQINLVDGIKLGARGLIENFVDDSVMTFARWRGQAKRCMYNQVIFQCFLEQIGAVAFESPSAKDAAVRKVSVNHDFFKSEYGSKYLPVMSQLMHGTYEMGEFQSKVFPEMLEMYMRYEGHRMLVETYGLAGDNLQKVLTALGKSEEFKTIVKRLNAERGIQGGVENELVPLLERVIEEEDVASAHLILKKTIEEKFLMFDKGNAIDLEEYFIERAGKLVDFADAMNMELNQVQKYNEGPIPLAKTSPQIVGALFGTEVTILKKPITKAEYVRRLEHKILECSAQAIVLNGLLAHDLGSEESRILSNRATNLYEGVAGSSWDWASMTGHGDYMEILSDVDVNMFLSKAGKAGGRDVMLGKLAALGIDLGVAVNDKTSGKPEILLNILTFLHEYYLKDGVDVSVRAAIKKFFEVGNNLGGVMELVKVLRLLKAKEARLFDELMESLTEREGGIDKRGGIKNSRVLAEVMIKLSNRVIEEVKGMEEGEDREEALKDLRNFTDEVMPKFVTSGALADLIKADKINAADDSYLSFMRGVNEMALKKEVLSKGYDHSALDKALAAVKEDIRNLGFVSPRNRFNLERIVEGYYKESDGLKKDLEKSEVVHVGCFNAMRDENDGGEKLFHQVRRNALKLVSHKDIRVKLDGVKNFLAYDKLDERFINQCYGSRDKGVDKTINHSLKTIFEDGEITVEKSFSLEEFIKEMDGEARVKWTKEIDPMRRYDKLYNKKFKLDYNDFYEKNKKTIKDDKNSLRAIMLFYQSKPWEKVVGKGGTKEEREMNIEIARRYYIKTLLYKIEGKELGNVHGGFKGMKTKEGDSLFSAGGMRQYMGNLAVKRWDELLGIGEESSWRIVKLWRGICRRLFGDSRPKTVEQFVDVMFSERDPNNVMPWVMMVGDEGYHGNIAEKLRVTKEVIKESVEGAMFARMGIGMIKQDIIDVLQTAQEASDRIITIRIPNLDVRWELQLLKEILGQEKGKFQAGSPERNAINDDIKAIDKLQDEARMQLDEGKTTENSQAFHVLRDKYASELTKKLKADDNFERKKEFAYEYEAKILGLRYDVARGIRAVTAYKASIDGNALIVNKEADKAACDEELNVLQAEYGRLLAGYDCNPLEEQMKIANILGGGRHAQKIEELFQEDKAKLGGNDPREAYITKHAERNKIVSEIDNFAKVIENNINIITNPHVDDNRELGVGSKGYILDSLNKVLTELTSAEVVNLMREDKAYAEQVSRLMLSLQVRVITCLWFIKEKTEVAAPVGGNVGQAPQQPVQGQAPQQPVQGQAPQQPVQNGGVQGGGGNPDAMKRNRGG